MFTLGPEIRKDVTDRFRDNCSSINHVEIVRGNNTISEKKNIFSFNSCNPFQIVLLFYVAVLFRWDHSPMIDMITRYKRIFRQLSGKLTLSDMLEEDVFSCESEMNVRMEIGVVFVV